MFDNVIGHIKQKEYFKSLIESKRLVNSYIFIGSDGIGKKTFAVELAKQILKVDNILASPDYKYISKFEDKKNIVIEQIRSEIIASVYERPVISDKKVYIIDDADLLNDQSQNALLKTFEEPPEYIVIILITSKIDKLKDTILSRAVKVKFDDLTYEEVANYISKKYSDSINPLVIEYTDNSIGKLDKIYENIKLYEELENYINNIEDYSKIEIIRERPFSNDSINEAIDYMEYLFLKKATLDNYKYSKIIPILAKAKNLLNSNCNYDIVIDNMMIDIKNNI